MAQENTLLKRARLEKGFTQASLAEILHVTKQAVGSWERGQRAPYPDVRKRLCEVLEKPPEQLGLSFSEDGEPFGEQKDDVETTALQVSLSSPEEAAVAVSQEHMVEPDIHVSLSFQAMTTSVQTGESPRLHLLNRVYSLWIAGVLQSSLYRSILLILRLYERPDAVENPWHQTVQESNLPTRLFPAGTRIIQVYDEADGVLLILGEPGAGKTTLLLELTRELILRAVQHEKYPLPVYFNLSSWAEKRLSLKDWLVEEFQEKYQIPSSIAYTWIEEQQVALLLDGLDEMAEEYRDSCIQEVNAYRQLYGLTSIVVCSRLSDYFAQPTRILLHKAIAIKPLTQQQVDAFTTHVGSDLATLRLALQNEPVWQHMASVPLMLNILSVAYDGSTQEEAFTIGSPHIQQKLVFERYVERVLQRRGPKLDYTPEQTRHWLSWLAQQLAHRSQAEFYIERMQPDWLPDASLRSSHRSTVVRIIYSLESIIIAGSFAWIRGGRVGKFSGVGVGLLGWLGAGPGNAVLGWMAPGLGAGLEGGGMLGLILGVVAMMITILVDSSSSRHRIKWSRSHIFPSLMRGLRRGLLGGVSMGVLCALIFCWTSKNTMVGVSHGIGYGLFTGLIIGLVSTFVDGLRGQQDQEKRDDLLPDAGLRRLKRRLGDGAAIGCSGGVCFAVVNSLFVGFAQGAVYGTVVGIAFGVAFGFGGGTKAIRDVGTEIKPAETASWNWQHVYERLGIHVRDGLLFGGMILLVVAIVIGLASSIFQGLAYGWMHGVVYGTIVGLVVGVASILTEILNTGWSSDKLEEHQFIKPNEGIRRSFRNSMFAGLLFGPMGGVASGIIVGIAFGLLGRLPGWPILAGGFAIIYTMLFIFVFMAIRGGNACIEHYVLRWRLWRLGVIPRDYVDFLDYAAERILLRKIGGGYMFTHRLLLEYFASLETTTSQTENTIE